MEIIKANPEADINASDIAMRLGVDKRRVFDILNVLDGIGLVKRKSKNLAQWLGSDFRASDADALKKESQEQLSDLTETEILLDKLIEDATKEMMEFVSDEEMERLRYMTVEDIQGFINFQDQSAILVETPDDINCEVFSTEQEGQVYLKRTSGPLQAYILN